MTDALKTRRLADVEDITGQTEQITGPGALPLFRGMLHAEVGEGESGKTWIAAHSVLDVARRGHQVLVLDGEMGAAAWRRRLESLGASPAELERVSYVEMDAQSHLPDALAATCASLGKDAPPVALLAWDSALSLLSRTARSENDNAEVARVYDRLRDTIRVTNVAGLIVDHTTRGSGTLISRGATAKFNALDISYGVRIVDGCIPGPIDPWSSVISVEKDRHGLLGKRADRAADFFPTGNGGLELSVTERDSATHRLSPTNPVTALVAAIDALDPPPTSGNDAYQRVRGRKQTVLAAYKIWSSK